MPFLFVTGRAVASVKARVSPEGARPVLGHTFSVPAVWEQVTRAWGTGPSSPGWETPPPGVATRSL